MFACRLFYYAVFTILMRRVRENESGDAVQNAEK